MGVPNPNLTLHQFPSQGESLDTNTAARANRSISLKSAYFHILYRQFSLMVALGKDDREEVGWLCSDDTEPCLLNPAGAAGEGGGLGYGDQHLRCCYKCTIQTKQERRLQGFLGLGTKPTGARGDGGIARSKGCGVGGLTRTSSSVVRSKILETQIKNHAGWATLKGRALCSGALSAIRRPGGVMGTPGQNIGESRLGVK
ncbi:hypothetical protein KEM48_014267 [Puccinia striiformis f. sp. tritici PST-130]|nr:hypothetical protein KEM48_014267 [Puccinia striiformis f. sp. tritici PST-130]